MALTTSSQILCCTKVYWAGLTVKKHLPGISLSDEASTSQTEGSRWLTIVYGLVVDYWVEFIKFLRRKILFKPFINNAKINILILASNDTVVYHNLLYARCKHFLKVLEDTRPFRGATDTPALDFRWHLPWISKPWWIPCTLTFSHTCNGFIRFTSGVPPGDCSGVSMVAVPFWSSTCKFIYKYWWGSNPWLSVPQHNALIHSATSTRHASCGLIVRSSC